MIRSQHWLRGPLRRAFRHLLRGRRLVLGKHSRDWSNEQLNAQDGQGAFDCHIRPHGVSFMQIKPYRMVVQKKRSPIAPPETSAASQAARRVRTTTARSISGYNAYFRTYTINVRLHKVTHHLEGALVSSGIGKNFNRSFQLRRSADPIRDQRIVSWEADDRTHLEKGGVLLFTRGPLRLTGGCTRAVLERRGRATS